MEIENELIHIHPTLRFDYHNDMEKETVLPQENLKQAESVDGVKWHYGADSSPPNIVPIYSPTHLKDDCKGLFTTPVHSLLQFIPIGMWLVMLKKSNHYAHEKMKLQSQLQCHCTISGKPWKNDINIDELMAFWGIMIHMCLRPMPGKPILKH